MKKLFILALSIPLVMSYSCKKKSGCTDELALNFDPEADLNDGSCVFAEDTFTYSTTYDSSTFKTSDLYPAIQSLISTELALPKNRPSGTNVPKKITVSELIGYYSVGNPTIWSIVGTKYKSTLENGLFAQYEINSEAVVDSVQINWSDLSQNPNGGMAGGYILNKDGAEMEQLLVKGGFGGIAFNYVKNVLFADPTALTQKQLDDALGLYGSNPAFTQKYQSAKYTKDRKKGSGTYHDAIALQFKKAQAAIQQNNSTEKTNACKEIISLWEEGLMAQVIYYTYDVIDYFSKTTITDTDKAKGCHAWSECTGIVLGFYQVTGKKITDAQVLNFLSNLNSQSDGLGKPYELIGDVSKLSKLETAIDDIAAIYGLNKLDHKRN